MSSQTEQLQSGGSPPPDAHTSTIAGPAVRLGDRIFRGLSAASGTFILIIMAAIAIFLLIRTVPAIQADTVNFFTTKVWFPDNTPAVFGIAALAWGTLLSSAIALVLAVPVSLGHRAVHRPLRARAGSRPAWATSSTCWPPSPPSSTACGAVLFLVPHMVGAVQLAGPLLRLDPDLPRARVVVPEHDVHHRRRPRRS